MMGLLMILFMTQNVHASDDWICKEASSQRNGADIDACGIGYGKDENEARLSAFENAKKEFNILCLVSSDCKDHEIKVSPARTTCEFRDKKYQCYRMIVFTVGDGKKPSEISGASKDGSPIAVVYSEVKEEFKPFILSEINRHPKIKKGMTKRQVFEAFGMPDSIDGHTISFQGQMCTVESGMSFCYVYLNANGKVESYSRFKPIYDGRLVSEN